MPGTKKYLLMPGNNSLSHVVKCLAVGDTLTTRGHEVRVAVSRKHSRFLQKLSIEHFVLPDIQEVDESGFPSVEWFRQPRLITDCINEEVRLLRHYQPDRVLGVFRFTLKSSARIAGVPYDSLVSGCLIPDSREVMGFADEEPGREVQRVILDGFFRYAGARLDAALRALGLPQSNDDIRHMLKGERTFLWDFPEFAPLPQRSDLIHVGPLSWNRWPYDSVDTGLLARADRPLAVMAFGTCTICLAAVRRIITVLLGMGYRVLLAAGGQPELLSVLPNDPRVITCAFAPLHKIFPHAALLVTHGGQMTVFEALQNGVPVLVMPFQPEQAHNGLCLERLGCGKRLVSAEPFQGNSTVYMNALDRMTDDEVGARISSLVLHPHIKSRLSETRDIIRRYGGVEALADSLEDF